MKLTEIKQEVYSLTCTKNTKQLKRERSDLTTKKDLRYKSHWTDILNKINLLREQALDLSLKDLEESEKMLKESLFAIGRLSGLDNNKMEGDWQRIQLEAQFADIHIEQL
ncbi:hypothetical protein I4641_04150 [Waterburya agarophytonicola K14]|uniref:Uncharacterized protein n=1 Tax=Waterburya agarophytonicola KI4 TaxID=2874699 RepID=A0A964FE00_9CYAN|nr:hypothetical protein [Waterburya agarophytonicola]MCC0176170.1 hypothetical protein [Waterburya agarophytonicola KI4]